MPGPYDLIYGFYSIGFHWSLEYYLDDLEAFMHERTLLVCTLNKNFRPFPRLEQFSTRVLACREVKKNASPLRLAGVEQGTAAQRGAVARSGFCLIELYAVSYHRISRMSRLDQRTRS